MKYLLIYLLCIALGVTSIPIAAEKAWDESLPTLLLNTNGELTEINIEEFALAVLIAEKPTHPQLMRALAISARSVGAYLSIFGCKHEDFDICHKGDCCFLLGDRADCPDYLLAEYEKALEDTYGEILTIDGIPAMALFCLCAGSGTAESKEFTYLSAVSDGQCTEHISESSLPYSALDSICEDAEEIRTNSVLVYEDNGKCDFAVIGGRMVSAEALAHIIGTESREFVLTLDEDKINAKIFGIGHGYGMSLCGAAKMANRGKTAQEIISFYYPDLILNKIYQP